MILPTHWCLDRPPSLRFNITPRSAGGEVASPAHSASPCGSAVEAQFDSDRAVAGGEVGNRALEFVGAYYLSIGRILMEVSVPGMAP